MAAARKRRKIPKSSDECTRLDRLLFLGGDLVFALFSGVGFFRAMGRIIAYFVGNPNPDYPKKAS